MKFSYPICLCLSSSVSSDVILTVPLLFCRTNFPLSLVILPKTPSLSLHISYVAVPHHCCRRLHLPISPSPISTTIPPNAAKLSVRSPCFHRRNCCLRPAASDKDLVPPGEILTASGARLFFYRLIISGTRRWILFSVRLPIPYIYLHLSLQSF